MAVEINWTNRAVDNLNHIYRYIAFDSDVYAKRFVKSLVGAVEKPTDPLSVNRATCARISEHSIKFFKRIDL